MSKLKLIILALLAFATITLVLAAEMCSIAGNINYCCDNNGYGPNCKYCTSLCTSGSNDVCDMSDGSCGSNIDCSGTVTALSSNSYTVNDNSFDWSDGTTVTMNTDYNDFFTNSNPTQCPILN
jgi:hypothetical protein